jgi:methyl-accepting chemotaxis protein
MRHARDVRSLSIRGSLLVVAAIALVVAAVVGVIGIVRAGSIADRTDAMYAESLQPLNVAKDLQQLVWHGRWASLSGTTASNPTAAKTYNDQAKVIFDQVPVQIKQFRTYHVSAAELAALSSFETSWAKYNQLRVQAVQLKAAGRMAEWENLRANGLNPTIAEAVQQIDTLVNTSLKRAAASAASARSSARSARTTIIVVLVAGLLIAGALALATAQAISRRLTALQQVLSEMADGDLTEQHPDTAGHEIGAMSRSVHRAASRMRETVREVAQISTGLSTGSSELQQASRSLAGDTDQASGRIGSIDAAAGEVSAGVQAVASGAEEMGAAIREISISATEAAQVAANAVGAAAQAKELMVKLDESSAQIDSVVRAITAIAEQTNLLALNATIEAARAGETGKGFAVVAGEVKDLAQETAKATEEISRRTEAIQADTRVAVDAIAGIGDVIERINDYQNTIASAVEEQSATTSNMTGDLNRAAGGTSQISRELADVVAVTATTRDAAQATERTAGDLADIATRLDTMVAAFRY